MARLIRVPQIDLASLLSNPEPHIDLKLKAYEKSTGSFLKAVADYKTRSIHQINERKSRFGSDMKRIHEKCTAVEAETNACKVKELELMSDLEKEKTERKDAELTVASLSRELSSLHEKVAEIEAEIDQYRAIVASLERDKNKERKTLITHSNSLPVQVAMLEKYLACVVEGAEADQILIRFTQVDESNPDREFSVILDVSSSICRVLKTSPPLPSLSVLVDQLYQTGDIYRFIVDIRQSFYRLAND
ncbi:kinetochore-associated Ndc80 complex subunit spc25 [Stygiomarasmius scandens]|uniref:Kinetochore protein SPC25 n=1 Tax=Marasmiellus scandens TaxID=2682957 RepID=A0ABR1J6G8_9AGAR